MPSGGCSAPLMMAKWSHGMSLATHFRPYKSLYTKQKWSHGMSLATPFRPYKSLYTKKRKNYKLKNLRYKTVLLALQDLIVFA